MSFNLNRVDLIQVSSNDDGIGSCRCLNRAWNVVLLLPVGWHCKILGLHIGMGHILGQCLNGQKTSISSLDACCCYLSIDLVTGGNLVESVEH